MCLMISKPEKSKAIYKFKFINKTIIASTYIDKEKAYSLVLINKCKYFL